MHLSSDKEYVVPNKREFIKLWLLCFLLSASLCGCMASFPVHKLPQYSAEEIPTPNKKLAVSYTAKSFSWSGENQRQTATLYQEINEVLQQSNDFTFIASDKDADGYHYSFYFRDDKEESDFSVISVYLSNITLGILPGHWRTNYSLIVEVKKSNQSIKNYVYQDQTSEWMQILLLPAALVHPTRRTLVEVVDNMLRNFVHDFVDDQNSGVLAKKNNTVYFPAKPDPNHAMIYIVRPSTYKTRWPLIIYLDGKSDRAVMGNNRGAQYIYFPVTPGEHEILSQNTERDSWIATSVKASKGETYFFIQDWDYHWNPHNGGRVRSKLTAIDAQEALAQILMSKPGSIQTSRGDIRNQ
jgi:hypothetical protein